MITEHRIGYQLSNAGKQKWHAIDATTLEELPGEFTTATNEEVQRAMEMAASAFIPFQQLPASQRAAFLNQIADNIEALGDVLVQRMMQESALSEARVRNERARTTGQLRMFATLITEGSWVDATIDHGDAHRSPPKPDLRKMLHPIGPVVVFTASNFPLAYSTAGGDTASALAAGCPVIVKAHEAHAGTNALVAEAILNAAKSTDMPDGVFSTLYARGFDVGSQLVTHPHTKAVGFTGSRAGGRALFDLASNRESPIPVFAEMSSVNPIFILPDIIHTNAQSLATQIAGSVNLGAGQFCTSPGLIFLVDNADTPGFIELLKTAFATFPALTMLNPGIQKNYSKRKAGMLDVYEVNTEFYISDKIDSTSKAGPAIASVTASAFLENLSLQHEVFGPFVMVIKCADVEEMYRTARSLEGQLTATVCGTDEELQKATALVTILREKAGRLVYNGVPTGVEVSNAMVHGGPYPATTDSRFTAVGASAISRWARPVAYQNCIQSLLPDALKDKNIPGIQMAKEKESLLVNQHELLEKQLRDRTSELNLSLEHLKATQQQLIHAEKMASLGELTSGIAHEIQNPLNFVNNFSEVSYELLDELQSELASNNPDQIKAIVEDLKQNLTKISDHGKRADSIVKGMLQHSRSGSGIKELSDINALADECLRLAFHGFRAKDKSFNATTITDFDPSINKIQIVKQDISRVILNLLTNAFYACMERSRSALIEKKENEQNFEPTVVLSTRQKGNMIEVSIKDNGNGIPKNILEKIFQPFFTTKPGGQGTGLGLSLSYEIITKGHGGEIKVNSREGVGTEFIICLPI